MLVLQMRELWRILDNVFAQGHGGDVLVRPDGVIAVIGSDNIQQWLHNLVLADSFT
jgi:hypothetical protein